MMLLGGVLFASLSSASSDGECESGLWRCDDGLCATAKVCDGELQCRDGSDESLARCRGIQRPLLGLILHCSQPGSTSHGVCPEACRRWPQYCYYAIASENGVPGTCELPSYPRIGDYSIEAIEPARKGWGSSGLADFTLLYSCPLGFRLRGNQPRCVSGSWTSDFPSCRQDRKCQLNKHVSVDYICIDVPNNKCPEWVESGQRVAAACRQGYTSEALSPMHCIDGSWDYVAICRSECGTTSSSNGVSTQDGLPWHATVYNKNYAPYRQICGGSLVSTIMIISAAHCFWSDVRGVGSADHFAVAVGKVHKRWAANDGQKSNVRDIKVPPGFRGAQNNFHEDIALVLLATRFTFSVSVSPVCIDFEAQFDELQLRPGNVGKVAVWNMQPTLNVLEVTSIQTAQCITDVPAGFAEFITSDKICAVPTHGAAICKGDSGGGLVYPSMEAGKERWNLRGIASSVPHTKEDCGHSYIAFTQLAKHQAFITSNYHI